MKIDKKMQLKIVIFTAVKNRRMLHGHVFVITKQIIKQTMLRLKTCNVSSVDKFVLIIILIKFLFL